MLLSERITKRLISKIIMDLRIATNPHLEQPEAKKLIDELQERHRAVFGVPDHAGELDKEALDMLKAQLKNNSKAITVK